MTSEGETSETLSTLIRTNDVEGAKTLLEGLRHSEAKALVCKQDKHLRTPLHLAAWKGNTEMTELLLTHRADPKTKAKDNFTALHFAAKAGAARVCETLIRAGVSINTMTDKTPRSALMMASAQGHVETVRVLVKAGARIYKKGEKDYKQTVLSLTSSSEVSKILLEALGNDQHEIGGSSVDGIVSKEAHQNDDKEISKKLYSSSVERLKASESEAKKDTETAMQVLRQSFPPSVVPDVTVRSGVELSLKAAAKLERKRKRREACSIKVIPACMTTDEGE